MVVELVYECGERESKKKKEIRLGSMKDDKGTEGDRKVRWTKRLKS